MGKDYIQILIQKFFDNDISPDIRQKFHYWFLNSKLTVQKEQAMEDIWETVNTKADEITYLELKTLNRRINAANQISRIPALQYLRQIAAILLLPLIGAFGAYYYLTHHAAFLQEPELIECFVPYGEKRQIILSDGSEVWVNAGSLLVYEKDFKGTTRSLFLSGEANFKVAKNPKKPFIVKTKYMDVEAVGTIFNVQSYPDSPHTTATLEEGKIKVGTKCPEGKPIFLKPNEQVVYNHLSKKVILKKADAAKNARWKQGYLIFQGATFGEIVQAIERRFGVTVNYEIGRYQGRMFTTKFTPDEELEQVLDILQKMIGFKYKVEKNIVFIYK